jgi:hypothetical protein
VLTTAIDEIAQKTDGTSGADLRESCDMAKRAALKRTGFTQAVPPTAEELLQAFKLTETK